MLFNFGKGTTSASLFDQWGHIYVISIFILLSQYLHIDNLNKKY